MRCTTELFARFNLDTSFNAQLLVVEQLHEEDRLPPGAHILSVELDDYLDDRTDALDFVTVPFESVESELSMELHQNDEAFDREIEAWEVEDDWDGTDEPHISWAAVQAARRDRRARIGAALMLAMQQRPDLNWTELVNKHNAGVVLV